MDPFITVKIPRPEFEDASQKQIDLMIKDMADLIATQIMAQELARKQKESIEYWQAKMIDWQIEDALHEMKYGKRQQ